MCFKNSLNNTIQLIFSVEQTGMKMTLRDEIACSVILLQWNTTIPQSVELTSLIHSAKKIKICTELQV